MNLYFGFSKIQIFAGTLFNLLLNLSVVVLIINLLIKSNQIKRASFIFLNLLLFIYFPIALNNISSDIFLIIKFLF